MALNVNRKIQDNFYRYKMPRIVAKVEGKGNGIKTVIDNMVDVAKALARPPTYTTKYFGCELGAQTQFDFKNERYIVNGSHDANKLQDILDGFIKKFVLCPVCENPETVYKVNAKKGIIGSSCKACGHRFTLDMTHKLTTFILKNPPEQDVNAKGTSQTQKKKKEKKDANGDADSNEGDGPEDQNGFNDSNEADDDDWCDDVSEEAVKKRMTELTSGVKNLAMDNDLEKTEGERVNIFHTYVKAAIATGTAKDKEIHSEAERLEIVNKAPIVLCELLFTNDQVVAAIKKNKKLFLRFTHENQKAQKYLLGGVEKTIEFQKDKLLPKTASILKCFYDEDIVDEEVLIEWGKKASKKYVSKELSEAIHKKAEPLIKWLKEAEEESSEEESDVELEFDERAKISSLKVKEEEPEPAKTNGNAPTTNGNGAAADEEEDDVDIDDI